ncbi:phospholipase D family protein [Desulfocurvibacter africanus]|uniref:phospholipase D family protein n=1 Tax=Desulfocurvibacter africanus TaxID=873 RepID=UPI0006851625|nr:phospholipase D family protein [Desulfocurvibacter africanus]
MKSSLSTVSKGARTRFQRNFSEACSSPETTFAGRFFKDQIRSNGGNSGFILLDEPGSAFNMRNGLAGLAERTLDLQYFIWEGDTTGRLLADAVIKAAQRGVRVRVLLDDLHIKGRDRVIALLDHHPCIEIRLFNPFSSRVLQYIDFLFDFKRLNRRMHNKVFIMDNAIAVLGGRNIGNEYFGLGTDLNFRDLDLLSIGPIVQDISQGFDTFWNSSSAVPVRAVVRHFPVQEELERFLAERQRSKDLDDFPYALDYSPQEYQAALERSRERFIWAEAESFVDDPDKENLPHTGVLSHLRRHGERIEQEILLEVAYFVPGKAGIAYLNELTAKGVRVRILTNSLATNDVVAAHSGYAKYRRELIESGVQLRELPPDPLTLKKNWAVSSRQVPISLHTKAMVFDRTSVFIGSMNLDPRSVVQNTETGLLVFSPELARQVAAFMDEAALPGNSYLLAFAAPARGKIVWQAMEEGTPAKQYLKDPETRFRRRCAATLLRILPEEQL